MIGNWNLNSDADRIKCVIYEDDPDSTFPFPSGSFNQVSMTYELKGQSFTSSVYIWVGLNDDYVGEATIEYCDDYFPNGEIYSPHPGVQFDCSRYGVQ